MSKSRTFRSPLFARPWFAALALTTGISAMALGAYTAETPTAFTSKLPHAAQELVPVKVLQQAMVAPTPVRNETSTINLGEMRIVGSVTHRRPTNPSLASTCTPGWRPLDIGSATQEVEDLCAAPENGPARPLLASNRNGVTKENLVLPRMNHGRLDAFEVPARASSLNDLLPPIPMNGG